MAELTSDQWRVLLERRLLDQKPDVDFYTAYYDGNHRLQFASSKFREAFGDLFEAFSTNWCALVVDAAVERLAIQGFRFGGNTGADGDAWSIWQANRLDAQSIMGHTEAVKCKRAYILVSPPPDGSLMPRITIEHPSQMVVEHDPADPARRLAALKRYQAANGDTIEVVYEPQQITVYRQAALVDRARVLGLELPPMVGVGNFETFARYENHLGVVPVVPLENNPSLMTGGVSDLKPAIALNDAANKFFSDMIVASEYQAFRQRVLTGVEIPTNPETGEPIVSIEMAMSRMLIFEEKDAKVFDLAPGDLANYVQGVDLAVQHLAAQTRTPPHYLLAKLVNLSGDALKAAETGLVARVRRKHIDFSDSWEEGIRLAFKWRSLTHKAAGDTQAAALDEARAGQLDAETIWKDPESRSFSELADGLLKLKGIGVPDEALQEKAGFSPQEIDRFQAMLQTASLLGVAETPLPPVVAPAAAGELPAAKPVVVA